MRAGKRRRRLGGLETRKEVEGRGEEEERGKREWKTLGDTRVEEGKRGGVRNECKKIRGKEGGSEERH